MPRVIELSEAALADFDNIYDSISKHNPRAAAKTLRALDAAIQHLPDQPHMGRAYQHGRHRLRLLTHRDYPVFYRERPGVIELVRTPHGMQNIPDILDEI